MVAFRVDRVRNRSANGRYAGISRQNPNKSMTHSPAGAPPFVADALSARADPSLLPPERGPAMLYAFLCYNNEAAVNSWTKEQDDAVMDRLNVVHEKHAAKMGPSLRLMPTSTATTLVKEKDLILDGPY